MKTQRIALRSLANGRIVCAESGGDAPLIANRDAVGPWETFEIVYLDEANGVPASPVAPPPTAPAPSPAAGGSVISRTIQVTGPDDGEFVPRMYSYWSNAVILNDAVHVFAGHVDGRPRFFQIKASGQVTSLGSLAVGYNGNTEGWYWDAQGWLYILYGPSLHRVNPFTGEDHVVFSIESTHPGCDLWQAHSSDDGQVHSATVRRIVSEGKYPHIGTVVCRGREQTFFEAHGDLDESHLTGNGRWLIIEEDNNNLIADLRTGQFRQLLDAEGAVSHCDTGPDFIVGEDNFAGACMRMDLATGERRVLFSTWGMGHVSVRGGRILVSDQKTLALVQLFDEGGSTLTHLLSHGMVGNDYDHQVMANLDPTGRVACWIGDRGTGRFDVYVTPVP